LALQPRREGNTIHITGTVDHDGSQNYDFEKGGLGHLIGAYDLQQTGQENIFQVKRRWPQDVQGTVQIDADGTLHSPNFTWGK